MCDLQNGINDVRGNILDYENLSKVMQDNQPDIIFHLIPGAFIIVAVLAFNFMGDALRDAVDPYSIL